MKRLIAILTLVSFACFLLFGQETITARFVKTGGSGTWSLAQFKYFDALGAGTGGSSCTGGTSACTVTITAPTAGHLLVAVYIYGASSHINTTPTGGQTWSNCATCAQGDSTNGFFDVYYVLSATATGQTSVTCNWTTNTTTYQACSVYDYAWTGATPSFDVAGGAVRTACTSCAAVSLTLTGTDVVIQTAVSLPAGTGVTAISGTTFTSPQQFYSNVGSAGALNLTSFTAPNWTMSPSSATVVMGTAFKGN